MAKKIEGATREFISDLTIVKVVKGRNARNGNLGDLTEFKDSILKLGLLQPVLLRKVHDPDTGTEFELIDGERRFVAVKELHKEGNTQVRLRYITNQSDAAQAEVDMVVANLQRKAFEPMEEAEVVNRFSRYGWSDAEIADKLSKSVGWVTQRKALSTVAPEVKEAVKAGMAQDIAVDLAINVPEKSQGQVLADAVAEVGGDTKKLRQVVAKKTGRRLRPGKKVVRETLSILGADAQVSTADNLCFADLKAVADYAVGDITEQQLFDLLNYE